MPTDEQIELDYNDEIERKQIHDYKSGNRRFPITNNVLMLLGDILQPQTMGFDFINMDMSFTHLDNYRQNEVQNRAFLITGCMIYDLKKPCFLERGKLATLLISSRSLEGNSMKLFTEVTTTQKQEFIDKTEKKTGFSKIFNKKDKNEQGVN